MIFGILYNTVRKNTKNKYYKICILCLFVDIYIIIVVSYDYQYMFIGFFIFVYYLDFC